MSKDELIGWIKKSGIWIDKSRVWLSKSKPWIIKNRKWILASVAFVTAVSVTGFSFFTKRYYAVEVNSKVIAMVSDKSQIDVIIQEIEKKTETVTGLNFVIPTKVDYKEVFAFGNKLTPESDIEETLESNLELLAEAYSINVDGRDIAYLKDKSTAESILVRMKDEYMKNNGGSDPQSVDFIEDINIIKKTVNIDSVQDEKTVFELLSESTEESKVYVVKKGDTVSEIAEAHKIKQSEIEKMNPGLDVDRIQIGQEIILSVPKYVINIKSIEMKNYEESIPYQVEYVETADLYKGQTKVKVEGKEGKKSVAAEVIKINGIVSEERVVEEKVMEEPQNKVVLSGTKERPSTLAYGVFTKPSGGSLTSRFGQRWGKLHTGIDIGCSSGTSVKAADGGKVTFAGWQGNYGKLVIIDHENGYTTYYGHLSSIKVKAGQRVARGEVIALSGATGNVTGPHLHFEVRKNGVPQNPLKYVNY